MAPLDRVEQKVAAVPAGGAYGNTSAVPHRRIIIVIGSGLPNGKHQPLFLGKSLDSRKCVLSVFGAMAM